MTDAEAVREVGWIARRARELAFAPKGSTDPAEHVEFYERKAALLRHIGAAGASESYTPEMVEAAEADAAEWRGKMRALFERESFTIRIEHAPDDDLECDTEHPCGPNGPCDAHLAAHDHA